jgi:hypothetical protein
MKLTKQTALKSALLLFLAVNVSWDHLGFMSGAFASETVRASGQPPAAASSAPAPSTTTPPHLGVRSTPAPAIASAPSRPSTGEERVSPRTGAVFIRDTSLPELNEAYRDPSGLIWGSIVMDQGRVITTTPNNARDICSRAGARLPTKEEFEQLAKFLGQVTAQGYSPYLADGITDFLPGLSKNFFWAEPGPPVIWYRYGIFPEARSYDFFFAGGYGGVHPSERNRSPDLRSNIAVRCVARR